MHTLNPLGSDPKSHSDVAVFTTDLEKVTVTPVTEKKRALTSMRVADLIEEFQRIGLPEKKSKYHAKQVFQWVYQRKVTSFDEMTDLSKVLRQHLKDHFEFNRPLRVEQQKSMDGTQKFLWKLADGQTIESVLIPAEDRMTICISSQVGCAMGCKFCLTGTMGLIRNLEVHEIVDQVLDLSRDANITNIVYMGMGEPLHNLENVARSVEILLNQDGLNFSKRKITISTSGLVQQIRKMNERLTGPNRVNLAISLNGSFDEQRESVMPINKAFNLEKLMAACADFDLEPHRRITFEYVVLKDVNDKIEDARRVIQLLKDIPSKVNLIPYNPHHGSPYERPDDDRVEELHQYFLSHNVSAMIRHSRGRDILAACGQLKSKDDAAQQA